MGNFTRAERETISAIRALAHSGLDEEAFRAKVGARLRSALQADASCVMDLDPLLAFPVSAVEHGWPSAAREPLATVLLASPASDPSGLVRARSGAVVAERLVDGRLADDPYFREHILAFGYRHEVQVPCLSAGRGRAFLCFTRTEARGAFEPAHLRLLDAVAPHVAAAAHASVLRRSAAASRESGVGLIVFDLQGRVELANDSGERWLRRATSPGRQYLLALRAFMSLVTRLTSDDPRAVPELLLLDPDTGLPTILRGEMRPNANGDPRVMVLIRASRLADHPPALVALGLTPREADVAIAIARGLSAKEIANDQRCSVHTVNDHSKKIFDKLGVSTRVALTMRLLGA